MASNVFGAKSFKPVPPEKGSFPLDYEGKCKIQYLKFMICLKENDYVVDKCRETSKDYLVCRMDNDLMAKETLANLGFKEDN